ncbi:hypothetical protein D9758_001581 [Tetrapyrgos nigripes]|uniref:Defective in cullin neddylation protein n=1 Tax=Tetrapyrgos nigripes TaxID=182062 RepID=A0A8H5LX06_9AGAR|nr:hypothetical protein D9758_001581 [Tetrapyrgos nigripes]
MPPKRKASEADTESTSSGRATRSSARLSNSKTEPTEAPKTKTTKPTKATASKSKKTTAEKEDDAPPAKKAKTTKTKTAPKTAKEKKGQKCVYCRRLSVDIYSNLTLSFLSSPFRVILPGSSPTNIWTPFVLIFMIISLLYAHNSGATDDERAPSTSKVQTVNSSQATGKADVYTPAAALELFKNYADEDDENVIGPEGLEKLCNDAQIPLDGAMPMILAWQFEALEMMKFTKEEWTKGTASLKISSLPTLQAALADLDELLIQDKAPKTGATAKKDYDKTAYRTYVNDKKAAFQKLYTFCFNLVKPEQSRNIDMETASVLWIVLLAPKYPVVKEVVDFVQEKGSYKAVNKDLWNMMLEFCKTVKPDLSNYEADGAWPTLLDDFAASKRTSEPTE